MIKCFTDPCNIRRLSNRHGCFQYDLIGMWLPFWLSSHSHSSGPSRKCNPFTFRYFSMQNTCSRGKALSTKPITPEPNSQTDHICADLEHNTAIKEVKAAICVVLENFRPKLKIKSFYGRRSGLNTFLLSWLWLSVWHMFLCWHQLLIKFCLKGVANIAVCA